MKTYFCYIHVAGRLTPEMRILSADETGDLRKVLLAQLTDITAHNFIDRIEVCNEANELIGTIMGDEGVPLNS